MIYFSEIKGKRVITKQNLEVGRLNDLIFVVGSEPFVTKAVILRKDRTSIIVPLNQLTRQGDESFLINDNYSEATLSENELYMNKNILDKQIIDIGGNKIVRVNDIVIQDKPNWLIAGVDIGFLGVLRWFGLEDHMQKILPRFGMSVTSSFLSWTDTQPLELTRGKVVVKKEHNTLKKLRPEDLADHLEATTISNVDRIIRVMDDEFAAEVIANLNVNYQNELFDRFSPEKAAKIIELIDPDEAVDILLTLPKPKREDILSCLEVKKRKELRYLLELPKTAIGERITSEYMYVPSDYTVRKVIDKIRKETRHFAFLNYVYVVNTDNQLVGVVNLHELMMKDFDIPLYRFMVQNVVVAHLSTPLDLIAKKMLKYQLHAIPIIDKQKKMIGIITLDDVAEFVLKAAKLNS